MTEPLISVKNVSKKFCRDLKRSLYYGMLDLGKELIGTPVSDGVTLRNNEFWAINNISFELNRGECLGILGHNGAGKTTLLRILNGLIKPDNGKVTIRGKVGALISLGAGFNPILTGKENVYAAGAILGLSKREIDKKYNSIVSFSELENFMDSPVQNYSSGMQVRLGFSVAAHMEPDILIIDEILAVGDIAFRTKCHNTITNNLSSCAIIVVTHSLQSMARLATKLLVLKNGENLFLGSNIAQGIDIYSANFKKEVTVSVGHDSILLDYCKVTPINGEGLDAIRYLDDMVISLRFKLTLVSSIDTIAIGIFDETGQYLSETLISADNCTRQKNGYDFISLLFKGIELSPGSYSICVEFCRRVNNNPKGIFVSQFRDVKKFRVTGALRITSAPFMLKCDIL